MSLLKVGTCGAAVRWATVSGVRPQLPIARTSSPIRPARLTSPIALLPRIGIEADHELLEPRRCSRIPLEHRRIVSGNDVID